MKKKMYDFSSPNPPHQGRALNQEPMLLSPLLKERVG